MESEGGGLSSMRERNYDVVTGRFLSNAPLVLAGGDPNLRVYAGNNPVSFLDPSGLQYSPSADPGASLDDYGFVIGEPLPEPVPESPWLDAPVEEQGTDAFCPIFPVTDEYRNTPLPPECNDYHWIHQWEDDGSLQGDPGNAGIGGPDGGGGGDPGYNCGCPTSDQPKQNKDKGPAGKTTPRSAFDPNDLTGPSGYDDERFVATDQQMAYTIPFENVRTAGGAGLDCFFIRWGSDRITDRNQGGTETGILGP